MSWQEIIFNRLNLQQGRTKLVLDKTTILIHKKFLDYIESRAIPFEIAQSLSDVLSMIQNRGNLVISSFIEPPVHLSNKVDVFIFDYNQLPVDIDYTTAQTLETDELILLLEYKIKNKSIKLINQENIHDEILKARKHEKHQRIHELTEQLEEDSRVIEDYERILTLGRLWGEYIYNCFKTQREPERKLLLHIDESIEKAILGRGILKNAFYATENNFKTVDRITAYIKGRREAKVALICFDGLGVAEWWLLKDYLKCHELAFSERFLFALVPTITSISRSAIYYGDCTSVYNVKNPNEEKKLKEKFSNKSCHFYREGDIRGEDSVLGVDFVSIIYNVFDDIAHDTKLPPDEKTKLLYFSNLERYLEKSNIKKEIVLLKQLDYTIFICSDHGCVVGEGNGQQIDRYLKEKSSNRGTLITKTALAKFYDVNSYAIPFLSGAKVALLAKNRTIFARKNSIEISHGGITLEELIVPFAEVV